MGGYAEIIAGSSGILGMDIWATIDESLHEHGDLLGPTLVTAVQGKTPVDTGALESSINFDYYPNTGDPDLVWVYASDDPQYTAWARIYVPYQEGGPLGLPTYTNAPRLMFMQTSETDGPPIVELWATFWINYALEECRFGAGVPL